MQFSINCVQFWKTSPIIRCSACAANFRKFQLDLSGIFTAKLLLTCSNRHLRHKNQNLIIFFVLPCIKNPYLCFPILLRINKLNWAWWGYKLLCVDDCFSHQHHSITIQHNLSIQYFLFKIACPVNIASPVTWLWRAMWGKWRFTVRTTRGWRRMRSFYSPIL